MQICQRQQEVKHAIFIPDREAAVSLSVIPPCGSKSCVTFCNDAQKNDLKFNSPYTHTHTYTGNNKENTILFTKEVKNKTTQLLSLMLVMNGSLTRLMKRHKTKMLVLGTWLVSVQIYISVITP